jgi:hypothetical protein
MRPQSRLGLLFVSICLAAALCFAETVPGRILWLDFDMKDIPEPKDRGVGYFETVFSAQFVERWKRWTDAPRLLRGAVGQPKGAANVNGLDEVPDSSWYTNRHHLRHMTPEQLVRGPNKGDPPDFDRATITKVKTDGVTPGLQLKDEKGVSYLIKFDNKDYPELQSGAEVISTKILYAAGYNVPENYIGYLDPARLQIDPSVEISEGTKKRAFTQQDLTRMLENAARRTDGRYRVLASKMLSGKPKGPFAQVGLRSDDPNDLIPHEHRRELRGLRVIASWINHWDMKEMNSLDMYVEENGRKFLRHYLIDFGSTLGGGKSPLEYFHGREYGFDSGNVLKEIFTFGVYETPDEKSAPLVFPEVGIFSSDDFNPGSWKPSVPVMYFDNMTSEDALWGTRVILSFSADDLMSIVKTAEYTNPRVADYVVKTLLERRRMIAHHWLEDGTPIGDFALVSENEGLRLTFSDFLVEHDLASKGSVQYNYEVKINGRKPEKSTSAVPYLNLGSQLDRLAEITIRATREGASSRAVKVYVQGKPGGGYGIVGISRA